MSDWRPSLLAATIVLFGGGFFGSVAADRSDKNAKGLSRGVSSSRAGEGPARASGKSQSKGQPTSPGTETTAAGIQVTPPANTRADTLTELNDGGRVSSGSVAPTFGTVTIAGKSYEGVSMSVGRNDSSPWLLIETNARYKRLRGVVGIKGDTDCPRNDARVSITDDQGQNLWGPERVSFNSPKRFDMSIKDLARVKLVQLSLASSEGSAGTCGFVPDDPKSDPAWGQVEFVK